MERSETYRWLSFVDKMPADSDALSSLSRHNRSHDHEHEHEHVQLDALRSLALHWPEYLIEAAGLCLFMISACGFATLLENPASPVRQAINDPLTRRVLMGMAMGLTAIGIIYSPWGMQSGAHINPSVTLTFYHLDKVKLWDALFYVCAQFTGGIVGVLVAAAFLGSLLQHPAVNYVVTMPGRYGVAAAFLTELMIAFLLMTMVLNVSNRPEIHRFTGVCAGSLVASYIILAGPISGMSMNPARSFGSAFAAGYWHALWLYFTAPICGMLLASEVYLRLKGGASVACAKLHHENNKRCIFCGKPAVTDLNSLLSRLTRSANRNDAFCASFRVLGSSNPRSRTIKKTQKRNILSTAA